MGNNIRFIYDQIARRCVLSSTNEDPLHPLRNIADGNPHTFVKSTTIGGTWDVICDLGAGVTAQADAFVLERADLLAAVGATIDWADSPDASAYTSRVSEAITSGDLYLPHTKHTVREYTNPGAKRAWRLRLTAGSGAVYALAGLSIGMKFEVGKNPSYPMEIGPARTLRGADFTFLFRRLSSAHRDAFRDYLAAVTPDFPADAIFETPSGTILGGGLPHWVHDPNAMVGLAPVGFAALVPVQLTNPDARTQWLFYTNSEVSTLNYRMQV